MEIKRNRIAWPLCAGDRMLQRGCEALAAGDGAVLVSLPGVRVCGSVARWLAAGPVGRYNGPR